MAVTVYSVAIISSNKVRLTTSEFAQGVNYNVKVSNVKSATNNTIDPEHNTTNFSGVGIPPQLSSALGIDSTHIDLTFNETMKPGSMVQYAPNYSVTGSSTPTIALAELDVDGVTVHLTFSTKVLNGSFDVAVYNVADVGGNILSPSHNTASYTYTYIFPVKNMIGISDRTYTEGSLVTVYGQGISTDDTYPTLSLKIDDVIVATWTDVKRNTDVDFDNYWIYAMSYIYPGQVTIDQIKVEFTNAVAGAPDIAGLHGWTNDAGSTAIFSCERDYTTYYAKVSLTEGKSNPSKYNSLQQSLGTVTADKALTTTAQFRAPVGMQGRAELWVFPEGPGALVSAESIDGTGDWVDVELSAVTPTGSQLQPQLRLISNSPDAAGTYSEWAIPRVWQELVENPNFETELTPWYQHAGSRVTVTLESELAGTFARVTISKDEAPTARVYCSLVYDAAQKKALLFGGWYYTDPYYDDTWVFNSATDKWAQISPTGGIKPEARGRYALVYDSTRAVFVLFGGHDGATYYNDTWEYNISTSTWAEASPLGGVAPLARHSPAFAFDSSRGVTVLFGGYTASGYVDDTWEYDGTSWTQVVPVDSKPTARNYAAMVYDSNKSRCVLFGGITAIARVSDTWEYNGASSAWVQISPTAGVKPGNRSEHGLAYDSTRKICVLFGGQDGAVGDVASLCGDTWEYDAATTTWVEVNDGSDPGVTSPSARVAFAMMYDANQDVCFLFGGYDGIFGDENWKYDGSTSLWDQFEINPDPGHYGQSHWNSVIQSFGHVGYNKELRITGKYRAAIGTLVRIDVYATPWTGSYIPNSYMTYPGTGDWEDFELFPFNTSEDHDVVEIRLITYSPDVNGVYADWKDIGVGINLIENRRFRPRTAVVDRIILDGHGYATVGPEVYSTGTWEPGDGTTVIPGYKSSIYLTNNGHFDYSEVDDGAIFEDVDSRIELYRKGNGVLSVTDTYGLPVRGASVTVAQTRHSFIFGSSVHWLVWKRAEIPAWIPLIDAYEARWQEIFNLGFAPFFWSTYEPTEGAYQTDFLDDYVDWCTARNNAEVRGMALLYNIGENLPSWVNLKAPEDIKSYLLTYITHAMTTYAGRVKYWEIVDEAAVWDLSTLYTSAPALTKLYRSEGRENLIWDVYNTARAADPTAYLEINDYNTNDRYFSLLRKLERDGVFPFDAIKLQSHMNEDVWSNQKLWALLNTLSDIKPELHLSEVSIFSGRPYTTGSVLLQDFYTEPVTAWATTAEGEAQQAIEVERFYKLAFSHPYMRSINWWDLSDFYAWLWSGSNTNIARGLLRPDMTKKPAFDVIDNLVNHEWRTNTSGTTNSLGQFSFRGFAGTYSITVSKAGHAPKTQSVTLATTGSSWTIVI